MSCADRQCTDAAAVRPARRGVADDAGLLAELSGVAHEKRIVALEGCGAPAKSVVDLVSAWRRMRRTLESAHAARWTSFVCLHVPSGLRTPTLGTACRTEPRGFGGRAGDAGSPRVQPDDRLHHRLLPAGVQNERDACFGRSRSVQGSFRLMLVRGQRWPTSEKKFAADWRTMSLIRPRSAKRRARAEPDRVRADVKGRMGGAGVTSASHACYQRKATRRFLRHFIADQGHNGLRWQRRGVAVDEPTGVHAARVLTPR